MTVRQAQDDRNHPDSAAPLRTLIVDDEPLAIERMQVLCAEIDRPSVIGTASDGEAALRLTAKLAPDLVLLDMTMPGMDGLAVARELGESAVPPAAIFVTAHEDFAVEAFDLDAIDYVLKPVGRERLERAEDELVHGSSPRSGSSSSANQLSGSPVQSLCSSSSLTLR